MDATVALTRQTHPQCLDGLVHMIVLPILPHAGRSGGLVQLPAAIDGGHHQQDTGQSVKVLLQPPGGEDAVGTMDAVVAVLDPLMRRHSVRIAGGGKGMTGRHRQQVGPLQKGVGRIVIADGHRHVQIGRGEGGEFAMLAG